MEKVFLGTFFRSVSDLQGKCMSLFDWMKIVRSTQYKQIVEDVRRLEREGKKDEVANKKKELCVWVPSGICEQGRKAEDPFVPGNMLMLDYDYHRHDWVVDMKKKLWGYRGIVAIYETPRMGMRVIVHLPSYDVNDYGFLFNVVSCTIDEIVGVKHDEHAADLKRITYASYDPNCLCIEPDQEVECFDIAGALSRVQREVYAKDVDMQLGNSVAKVGEDGELEQVYIDDDELLDEDMQREPRSKRDMDDILYHFTERCPLVEGNRNNNLCRLGQYAHYKRFSTDELDYLIEAVHKLIGDREYTMRRIRQCVCWGYRHNDGKQEDVNNFPNYQSGFDISSKSHKSQKSHSHRAKKSAFLQNIENQANYSSVVQHSCPFLSETVYDLLPDFFKPIVKISENPRLNDMALVSFLTAASAIMPNLTVQCRKKTYSTHLYNLFIAPPASNKSVMLEAPKILQKIQDSIDQRNKEEMEKYEARNAVWKHENALARKENRDLDLSLQPGECPFSRTLVAEAQTSRSMLLADLSHNPHGMFIYASELKSLIESLNGDCGQFSAELAAINMNEHVGCRYKNEGRTVGINDPKLAILGSGNAKHYVEFIGNTEEGMESRAFTMLLPSDFEWDSWGDCDEEAAKEYDEAVKQAAEKAVVIYEYLKKFPTHVTVPQNLRRLCDRFCKYYNDRMVEDHYTNLLSIVRRLPILISRMCGIFCGIRKVEMGYTGIEMEATEADVEAALKIALMQLQHTCTATTLLVEDGVEVNPIHSVFTREDLFQKMPEQFTMGELLETGQKTFNHSRATVYRMRDEWLAGGFLVRVTRGIYQKTGKTLIYEKC